MSVGPGRSRLGLTPEVARHGLWLSITGVGCWLLTMALWWLIAPPDRDLAKAPEQADRVRMILAVVIGGLGTFAGTIFSTLGLLFSLESRRFTPSPRADLGAVLGFIGTATLLIVLAVILYSIINR